MRQGDHGERIATVVSDAMIEAGLREVRKYPDPPYDQVHLADMVREVYLAMKSEGPDRASASGEAAR